MHSTASKVIALMYVKILDFTGSPFFRLCKLGEVCRRFSPAVCYPLSRTTFPLTYTRVNQRGNRSCAMLFLRAEVKGWRDARG